MFIRWLLRHAIFSILSYIHCVYVYTFVSLCIQKWTFNVKCYYNSKIEITQIIIVRGWLNKSWCFDKTFCTAAEKNQISLCIFIETCPKYVTSKKTNKIAYSITFICKNVLECNIFLYVYNSFRSDAIYKEELQCYLWRIVIESTGEGRGVL